MDDPYHFNRCTYQLGPERCAYLARYFPNCTEQSRQARLERGVCEGHYELGVDIAKGREVLSASLKAVPIDFDYSTPHLIELSLEEYEAGRIPMDAPEWFKGRPDGR